MRRRDGHVQRECLDALLRAHGATLADVISIRTYLTDISRLAEYGTVRREFLTGTPPTSMTFEVSRLFRPEAMVEVEVVAAVAGGAEGTGRGAARGGL